MSRFKVGNYALVNGRGDEGDGWQNTWVRSMDKYIGYVGVVTDVRGNDVELSFRRDEVDYGFPASGLTKMEKAIETVSN